MKNWYISLLVLAILITLIIKSEVDRRNRKDMLISGEQLFSISFQSKVRSTDFGRGIKVKFYNNPFEYDLSGYCNDSLGIYEKVEIGDSLFKEKNANIILQKSVKENKYYKWFLHK